MLYNLILGKDLRRIFMAQIIAAINLFELTVQQNTYHATLQMLQKYKMK